MRFYQFHYYCCLANVKWQKRLHSAYYIFKIRNSISYDARSISKKSKGVNNTKRFCIAYGMFLAQPTTSGKNYHLLFLGGFAYFWVNLIFLFDLSATNNENAVSHILRTFDCFSIHLILGYIALLLLIVADYTKTKNKWVNESTFVELNLFRPLLLLLLLISWLLSLLFVLSLRILDAVSTFSFRAWHSTRFIIIYSFIHFCSPILHKFSTEINFFPLMWRGQCFCCSSSKSPNIFHILTIHLGCSYLSMFQCISTFFFHYFFLLLLSYERIYMCNL